jgi:uncharacterized membrane protein YtjA (UPF0391 family)
MLRWTVIFFIGALTAALFQFLAINTNINAIAKVFYFIFISLCVLTVIFEKESDEHKYITNNKF